jgi:hypothetical protein
VAKKRAADLPLGPLADLMAWWRRARVKGMIIGGLAVALLGRPRTTRDVDAVILLDESAWPRFFAQGKRFSFQPRVDDLLSFARQHRVLLVHHQKSGIDVDVSLGGTPYEVQAVARATKTKVGRLLLPLPTPEDLIILKGVAHRAIDLQDIDGLLALHRDIDKAYVRRWLDEFAQILEAPHLYEEIDRRLRKRL